MTTQPYTPIVPLTDVDTNLQNDVDKLNYLLRMEHNSVRGYEHAIDNVSDENLKARFKEYRQAHSERGTRISNMITSLNGQPETDGSLAGALHRNWVDLKTAVANDDSEAVMEAVVFGERNQIGRAHV